MELILFIVNWLSVGGIYALLAVGFSLVFGVARMANFAHTALYMLTGFVMYIFSSLLGYPILISAILGIISAVVVAVGYYALALDRLKEQPLATLILTLALALIIQEVLLLFFQANLRGIEPFFKGFILILDVRISHQHIFTIVSSIVVIFGVMALLTRTRAGRAIRAVSQDAEMSTVMGIDVGRILLLVMALATALAGIAAVIILPLYSIQPYMWLNPMLIIIAAVVLGGLGSIKGSIIGAFVLAFAEILIVTVVPIGGFLRGVASLLAMVVVLMFRPEGLFGVVFEEERL